MTANTILGLKKIQPFKFSDKRGDILEVSSGFTVKAITHTRSYPKSFRGIHVQGWDKIVYLASGGVHALFVDDRKGSETYGKVLETTMFAGDAYFVPKGVGNSYFVADSSPVDYFYFNSEEYDAKKTYTIPYKFHWDLPEDTIISTKDKYI